MSFSKAGMICGTFQWREMKLSFPDGKGPMWSNLSVSELFNKQLSQSRSINLVVNTF